MKLKKYIRFDFTSHIIDHGVTGGVLRFYKWVKGQVKAIGEIGFYKYGMGLFFDGYFEFYCKRVSFRQLGSGAGQSEWRENTDERAGIYISGDRFIGSQGPDLSMGFGDIDKFKRAVMLRPDGWAIPVLDQLPVEPPSEGMVLPFFHEGTLKTMESDGNVRSYLSP